MKEMLSSVSPKGQVTLPVDIRRLLGVEPKDKVAFQVEEGQVKITRVRFTLESVAGSVEPPAETEDLDRMILEAKEEHAQKVVGKVQQR